MCRELHFLCRSVWNDKNPHECPDATRLAVLFTNCSSLQIFIVIQSLCSLNHSEIPFLISKIEYVMPVKHWSWWVSFVCSTTWRRVPSCGHSFFSNSGWTWETEIDHYLSSKACLDRMLELRNIHCYACPFTYHFLFVLRIVSTASFTVIFFSGWHVDILWYLIRRLY